MDLNWVHKLITLVTNPLTVSLVAFLIALLLMRRRKLSYGVLVFSWGWLYLWSIPLMTKWIGLPLELAYPPMAAEEMPKADVVCLLGGGMGVNTNECVYPEMWQSADRVWHAARLYKAGKAKKITITGSDAWSSTIPLLADLGVSTNDVIHVENAKNTEGEARFITAAMKQAKVRGEEKVKVKGEGEEKKKILLVTSAWHMRRAELLFRHEGMEVIPAAADYEVTIRCGAGSNSFADFKPEAEVLERNTYLLKEQIAYWCYRLKFWLGE